MIFDIVNQTPTEYIPGESRYNWDGRISPDGTQIAFVSTPMKGNESPDIFIIPISGGEPVRVVERDFMLTGSQPDFKNGMVSYDNCTMLISWR